MEPRFIMKSHTGGLRPGNYSILIAKCTYPDKSSYPESVERRLAELLGKGKESVAKYTVLTATQKNRGFGFLRDNMIWNWKGHVVNTVLKYLGKQSDNSQEYFELSKMEKIAYIRYFLETEAALILALAKRLTPAGELSYSALKSDIQNIFDEIYEAYIDMASDLRTRTRIKRMLAETRRQMKSREHTYATDTLAHKIKPHIEAFLDLGLIVRSSKEKVYSSPIYDGVSALTVLSNRLGNFARMEEIFASEGYFPTINEALGLNAIKFSLRTQRDRLEEAILYGYEAMKDEVTEMADIEALVDWCCIKLLSEHGILVGHQDVEDFLGEMRRTKPSSVRYHVDGKGRIAYLILRP